MCGIFAVYNDRENHALKTVFEGLKSLEYRGYDSWGIVAKKNNGENFIIKEIGKLPPSLSPTSFKIKTNIALGHTRWATHGGINKKNAHPHFDCQQQIFVVHNGIIENFNQLKNDLIKKRHRLISETDSEIFAHLIEEEWKKIKPNEKFISPFLCQNLFQQIKGLNAFIIFIPATNQIFAIKNSSPIVFGIDKKNNQYFLASDYGGIIEYTNQIYFLEDEELLMISETGYFLYDKNGEKKKPTFFTINQKKERSSLGQYRHYMIKEISEQPRVIKNLINTQKNEILKLAKIIKKSYGNYFIGCGTAYYAALTGTYLFSKIAKRHTNASIASEFAYLVDFLKPESLVITLSQSGETIDIISSVKKTKEKKTKVFAITNVLGSTLYRMADYKILLNAGPEKCVVATKSFTAKIAILILLAYALNGGIENGIRGLKISLKELEKIINDRKIRKIAEIIKSKKHIFILGRGLSYPLALEAALKIKEVSYLHAEGFAAGELKHGVIALIEKGTPVIVFNPQDETYEDTLSSCYEVKARGAYLIGISSKKNPIFDQFIEIKNSNEANLIPYIAFAQLLGYYLALALGHDPDKPRNLAKSVTVK